MNKMEENKQNIEELKEDISSIKTELKEEIKEAKNKVKGSEKYIQDKKQEIHELKNKEKNIKKIEHNLEKVQKEEKKDHKPIKIEKKLEHIEQEMDEEFDIEKKKQEIVSFIKRNKNYIPYLILTAILWVAYKIRTSNLPLLIDKTTNKYIPLALDPFVFLRYAQHLLEFGTLKFWDTMRYFPYGYDPTTERTLLSYFSVYFYKLVHLFIPSFTLEKAHILYPPVAFVIGMIFFYLLVKKLFNFKISLLATATLAFIPTYLYRTMAGFADKEALGFLFYFLTIYLYITAWGQKEDKKAIFIATLAGISTGLMAHTWGGSKFIFLTIGGFTLLEILINKFSNKEFYIYSAWFIPIVIMLPVLHPDLLDFKTLATSFTSSIMLITFVVGLIQFIIFEKDLFKQKEKISKIISPGFASLIIAGILGIIFLSIIFGPSIIPTKVSGVYNDLISPFGQDRWQLTVAENHQPFFTDWVGQMGWLFILTFFIGSGLLFYEILEPIKTSIKKFNNLYLNRISLTLLFSLFLFFFTCSRYERDAVYFNGTNNISKFAYVGSFAIFAGIILSLMIYSFYKNKTFFNNIKEINKSYLFVLIWFIIMLVAARSASRLFMVLAPVTAILSAYLIFKSIDYALSVKDNIYKYALLIIIGIIVFSPFSLPFNLGPGYLSMYYFQTEGAAAGTGPSYNYQWQIAGEWVRENVPEDAVFIHWWDYGYWVQGGFERATVTDGGNAHSYWNYQVGRHVLTAQNETEALEVMYAHNVTNLLIISDEIGKYTAYSSIGADEDYDRYSWIKQFTLIPSKTQEKRDENILFYEGIYPLDDDFIYEGQIYPKQASGIGGFFLPITEAQVGSGEEAQTIQKFKQPVAALFYNGQRKDVPVECLYINNVKTTFDTPGLKGCFTIIPTIEGNQMNPIGAALYVSEEGVNALWTKLFIYNKPSENFELIYDDSDQMPLAIYQGRQIGPLKIWKVNYPEGFTVSEEKIKLYQGFEHEDPDSTKI